MCVSLDARLDTNVHTYIHACSARMYIHIWNVCFSDMIRYQKTYSILPPMYNAKIAFLIIRKLTKSNFSLYFILYRVNFILII